VCYVLTGPYSEVFLLPPSQSSKFVGYRFFFKTLRKSDHVLLHHSRKVNIETELIMHNVCSAGEAPHSESELYSASGRRSPSTANGC
jgi:hypothetical protein